MEGFEKMNTPKHTPGEWKIYPAYKSYPDLAFEIWNGDYRIATTTDGAEQAKINARLIAAAPDLLEACKEIVEAGKRDLIRTGIHSELWRLEQAIAKAEGR